MTEQMSELGEKKHYQLPGRYGEGVVDWWVTEQDRFVSLHTGYFIVLYKVSDQEDETDILANVEARGAIFKENPDELVPEKPRYSYGEWGGWKDAVWDGRIEHLKQADDEAEQFANEHARLTRKKESGYYSGYNDRAKDLYQNFLEAIDTLVADPENAEAWAAVDRYRNSKKHDEER